MVPSASAEPVEPKFTVSGAVPEVGEAVSTASGGCCVVAGAVPLIAYWPMLP